jgi:hypothetical protein
MTHVDFPYNANFPTLTTTQIDAAIGIVSADWYGSLQLWATLPTAVQTVKRFNLLANLTAWWLSVMYPSALVGIVSDGGRPVSSKTIGGTSLSYADIEAQSALRPLLSNTFGIQAIIAITSAPERFTIYG